MHSIIFEDNHLLVAIKPFGIATQTEPDGKPGFDDQLKAFIKKRDSKPGNVFLHAVHRLDKPVSGIVVFAKSQKALSRCNESLREQEWDKVYLARVEGKCTKTGRVCHKLIREHDMMRVSSSGKECTLEILESTVEGDTTLLKIRLESGRHHQIRAQCKALGHPILGDTRYGSTRPFKQNSIALIHSELTLPHPVQKTMLTLKHSSNF